ncbi:hypothetical protein [Salipaludibacillus sp. CF4.18]|uniref:hypothetical protein n=1 Tax=Salipaludibacillus sp. CF4.18 TaxID=3373081 RepID=UPI003EE42DD9
MKNNLIDCEEIFRDRKRCVARGSLPKIEKQIYDFFINSNIEVNQEIPPFQKVAERYGITVEAAKQKILEIECEIEKFINEN